MEKVNRSYLNELRESMNGNDLMTLILEYNYYQYEVITDYEYVEYITSDISECSNPEDLRSAIYFYYHEAADPTESEFFYREEGCDYQALEDDGFFEVLDDFVEWLEENEFVFEDEDDIRDEGEDDVNGIPSFSEVIAQEKAKDKELFIKLKDLF